MPTALMLSLRPTEVAKVGPHVGRAAHAAFYQALSERDAPLAERIHATQGIKPFTTSDLLGLQPSRDERRVTPTTTYGLRWTGLTAELDAHLAAWAKEPPGTITLMGTQFMVESATLDPQVQPRAGTANWNQLVALEDVGRKVPPDRFDITFLVPTTFRSSGRNTPLPLPELVFASLLDRWNAVAPLALRPEVRRFAAECLVMGRYTLESRWIPFFEGGEMAFTGHCSYVAINRDRYYLHCCATLLRFGFFSGVGAKTSMGFGMIHTTIS